MLLHRTGHTQGDDFALYLRQARSLFDGDIGQVVSDNRFAVLNSDSGFSPIAYPWVWPLLLSPFVHAWGLDYDRLKLVEVAAFCLWLVLLHGIVRRRIGWWPAIAIVAVFATSPLYLAHTDQLLTEFPHLAAVAARDLVVRPDPSRRHPAHRDRPARLIALGALIVLAFNVRRESIVLLGVIGVMQAVRHRHALHERAAVRCSPACVDAVRTTLAGDRDTVRRVRRRRRARATAAAHRSAPRQRQQLGVPRRPDERVPRHPERPVGSRRPHRDRCHRAARRGGRRGDRCPTATRPSTRRCCCSPCSARSRSAPTCAASTATGSRSRPGWRTSPPWRWWPASAGCSHDWGRSLRSRHRDGARCHSACSWWPTASSWPATSPTPRSTTTSGGCSPARRIRTVAPIFEAVDELTPPDAIVAYYRARTMTLLTDRRAFQTKQLDKIVERADYYAERRNSTYWQPELSRCGRPHARASRRSGRTSAGSCGVCPTTERGLPVGITGPPSGGLGPAVRYAPRREQRAAMTIDR